MDLGYFPTLLRILRSKVLILWAETEKQGKLSRRSLYIRLSWDGMRIKLYNQVYFFKKPMHSYDTNILKSNLT